MHRYPKGPMKLPDIFDKLRKNRKQLVKNRIDTDRQSNKQTQLS